MGLIDEVGEGPVGIDTALFIYFIETSPFWAPIVTPLFMAADACRLECVTSTITLLEVLVVPYRAGNPNLAARYEALLTRSRGIKLIDISREHMRLAAQVRAVTGNRTPDALQMSVARLAGCSVFVANDKRLRPIPGLRIVQLADHVVA